MPAQRDVYSNLAVGSVTMSAANTLTFSEIQTGISLFEKIAWIIARIEYAPARTAYHELAANTDSVYMAVVTSSTITTLDLDEASVIDKADIIPWTSGTAGSMVYDHRPLVHDFTGMPGGGLIIPPRPLYVAMDSDGFGSAESCHIRIRFTQKTLKPDEYWELVEAYRVVT